MQQLLAPSTFY